MKDTNKKSQQGWEEELGEKYSEAGLNDIPHNIFGMDTTEVERLEAYREREHKAWDFWTNLLAQKEQEVREEAKERFTHILRSTNYASPNGDLSISGFIERVIKALQEDK